MSKNLKCECRPCNEKLKQINILVDEIIIAESEHEDRSITSMTFEDVMNNLKIIKEKSDV